METQTVQSVQFSERDSAWQPGLLKGESLVRWASTLAEMATVRRLSSPRTSETVQALTTEIHQGASYAIDMSPQITCRECKPGCPDCCHVMVGSLAPEALVLADYLRNDVNPDVARQVQTRAAEVAEKTANLDHNEYAEAKVPCPLLADDGTCLAHSVRPIRCRGWCSLSAERCAGCFASSLVNKTVPLDAHAYQVGQGMEAGFSAGLTGMGLDGSVYVLASALVAALDTADATKQWVEGEPIFAGCTPYR